MSAESGPNGTQPLPAVEGDPAADPANLDPAQAGQPGEAIPAEVGPVMPVVADESLPRDGYVRQSREAYKDAKERGKQFVQHVGHAVTPKFVRLRKKGSAETTDTAESTPDDVKETRISWKDRATAAGNRTMRRLENRWEKRQQVRENDRYTRKGERIMRLNERDDQRHQKRQDRVNRKRQEDVDRRTDRLDDKFHKATMTRKEFRGYREQKQARQSAEQEKAMWAEWRAQQEAKQRAKRVKQYVREHEAQQKAAAKTEKAERKAAARAEGPARKMNQRYDERQTQAATLRAEQARIAKFRDDPEAYTQYLKEQADQKHERRQARVQRVQKIGGKILHGANVATKVGLGAAVNGGEISALYGMYAAEAIGKDERVQYAKLRAELGWVAVRKSLGEILSKAGERVMPTSKEIDTMAQTGEFELAPGVEVSVDLHPAEPDGAEAKVPVDA
jgi:hypothetical protein